MENIRIVNEKKEQIELGKKIFELKKEEIYNEKMCKYIKDKIDIYMSQGSEKEKEDMFYVSVYDYWAYGVNITEFFFYRFNELKHEEKMKYITFRGRYEYYWHMNNKEESHVLNNKFETYIKFKEHFHREVIELRSEKDYELFCSFIQRHPKFIVKPSCLGLTIGVHKVNSEEYGDKYDLFTSILEEGREIKKQYNWKNWEKTSSVVIEELICQAEEMSHIHPFSINIVRIPTIRKGETVHIFHPWFKFGNKGEFITAEAFGSLMAGINAETGIVDTIGVDENGIEYEKHPHTGVKILGYKIPMWDQLVDLVKELAKRLDGINYVGWDMALSENGWCIVEGNFDGEFLDQLVYHKGNKDELEQLLEWKPSKHFWWE